MLPWRLSSKHPKPSQTSASEPAKPPTGDGEAQGTGRADAREALGVDGKPHLDRTSASRPSQPHVDGAGGDFPLLGRLGTVPQE
jgi:hypothetical protein